MDRWSPLRWALPIGIAKEQKFSGLPTPCLPALIYGWTKNERPILRQGLDQYRSILLTKEALNHPAPATTKHWTASSKFGTYPLCEQRRFRRACASAQSRQNLRCSLMQAVNQEEPSNRKPDPWPLWMAGHAQLKFVMTECSKTQIRLTGITLIVHCRLIWTFAFNKKHKINSLLQPLN